jgi:hypothetical protein
MRPAEEMWTPPPRQRRHHPFTRRVVLISVALLVALVVTFIFVYQHAAAELDEQLKAEYAVTHYVAAFFVPTAISSMSYDDVLAHMSSFGLTFHNLPCGSYETPESFPGSQEGYLSGPDHFLALGATILSPPDWETRIRSLPFVARIETRQFCDGTVVYYHEQSWSGQWRRMTNPLFSPLRDPAPIRLHASDATSSYEYAVRLALEMGFRLADPAYEAAVKRGEAPAWHPVDQADMFASQHMLLVAPTFDTPRDWKNQVAATHVFRIT